MNILSKVADFVGGSMFKEIKETVMAYLPPKLSPQEKIEVEIALEKVLMEKQKIANQVLLDASKQLDKRIERQEGTAKDLLALPFIGRVMIFLRGVQRPAWGFATMYMDFKWFFDTTQKFSEQQEMALTVINLLVLGFLFGERTVKNLEPLILKIFDRIVK